MPRKNPAIVGHRGWPARFPDNTWVGIEAAFKFADMVEIDVRRTADGRLVLSHDARLGGRMVCETSWPQLASIDLGGGNSPVLLEELLESVPGPLNLEVKNDPAEPGFESDHAIAREVVKLARAGDLLTSFYWPSVEAARSERPAIETGLLVDGGWSVTAAIDQAGGRGHRVVAVHWSLLDDAASVCREAERAGVRVVAWTVNDPDMAIRLAEGGVAAIITDAPDRLAAVFGKETT